MSDLPISTVHDLPYSVKFAGIPANWSSSKYYDELVTETMPEIGSSVILNFPPVSTGIILTGYGVSFVEAITDVEGETFRELSYDAIDTLQHSLIIGSGSVYGLQRRPFPNCSWTSQRLNNMVEDNLTILNSNWLYPLQYLITKDSCRVQVQAFNISYIINEERPLLVKARIIGRWSK